LLLRETELSLELLEVLGRFSEAPGRVGTLEDLGLHCEVSIEL
jgi:hypothetical protein